MTRESRARGTRSTRPIGVPNPPITLAATSMPITEIPARLAARKPNRRDRDCVETPGAADSLGQPAAPAELGTHYVGGGGQQDGRATAVEVMSPAANRSAVAEPASGRSAWAASCAETTL
jgi:hypothetical protein